MYPAEFDRYGIIAVIMHNGRARFKPMPNIKQKTLADRCGLKQINVSNIENLPTSIILPVM
jgi:hypothetical protein